MTRLILVSLRKNKLELLRDPPRWRDDTNNAHETRLHHNSREANPLASPRFCRPRQSHKALPGSCSPYWGSLKLRSLTRGPVRDSPVAPARRNTICIRAGGSPPIPAPSPSKRRPTSRHALECPGGPSGATSRFRKPRRPGPQEASAAVTGGNRLVVEVRGRLPWPIRVLPRELPVDRMSTPWKVGISWPTPFGAPERPKISTNRPTSSLGFSSVRRSPWNNMPAPNTTNTARICSGAQQARAIGSIRRPHHLVVQRPRRKRDPHARGAEGARM
jgi:hypothetical protein